MFISLLYILTDRLRDEVFLRFLHIGLLFFPLHKFQQLLGTSPLAVESPHVMNKVLKKSRHVLPFRYDQIDIAMTQLERQALPAEERYVFEVFLAHWVEMLPEHPETCIAPTKDDRLNLVNVAAGWAWVVLEVLISIHLRVGISLLSFFLCRHFFVLLLSDVRQLLWVGLKHMSGPIDRLPIINR